MRIEKDYNHWEKKWVVALILDEDELESVLEVIEREWIQSTKMIGPLNVDLKVS